MTAPTEAPTLAPHLETLFTVAAAHIRAETRGRGTLHEEICSAAAQLHSVDFAAYLKASIGAWAALLTILPDRFELDEREAEMSADDATLALLAAAAVCRGEPVAYTLDGYPVPQLPAFERDAYEDAEAVAL